MIIDNDARRAAEQFLAHNSTLDDLDFEIAMEVFTEYASHSDDPEEALFDLTLRERAALVERILRRESNAKENSRKGSA